MSATDVARVLTKLQNLSSARTEKVLSLIEDLAELEALEDAQDLKEAREALAEIQFEAAATMPYEQFRRELERGR